MLEGTPIAILAGGLATRLQPLTRTVPKALIEVAGRPFLWHQLQLLKRNGIRRVVLCVGHLGEMIESRFRDGSELGIEIQYSYDGPELLGTAGAVRKALPLLDRDFFVMYGDSYLDCNYPAVYREFRRSNLPGLMTVFRNDGRFDVSNVEYADGQIVRYDKRNPTTAMRHIDYGLGVLDAGCFSAMPTGIPSDLSDLYSELAASGRLAAFEVKRRFYEIGSIDGLRETSEYLSGSQPG